MFVRRDLEKLARDILEKSILIGTGGLSEEPAPEGTKMAAVEGSIHRAEVPTARFTAVNGKDQKIPVAGVNSGSSAARTGSDERSNGQPRASPGREKLTLSTTGEDWPPGERAPLPDGPKNPTRDTSSENEVSHKRKRSDSTAGPNDQQTPATSAPYHGHSITTTSKTLSVGAEGEEGGREDGMQPPPQSDTHDAYPAETPYPDTPSGDTWYTQPENRIYESQNQHQQLHVTDDQHIGEVIQRENERLDAQNEYGRANAGDDSNKPAASLPFAPQQFMRDDNSPQGDVKKRKRNFSNRTKTGCMTCRRRKKKCDETKPECKNCLRGGFVCSGYQVRGQWQKTEQKQTPVPLQSKNDYESPINIHAQPAPFSSQPTARRDLPAYRGQQLRVDPQHGTPAVVDDDQASTTTSGGSATSPEHNRLSAISYQGQTPTPISASTSAHPDRLPLKGDYPCAGPLDKSRQEGKGSELATPQSATSNTSQAAFPPTAGSNLYTPTSAPSTHTNLQMVAQTAQLAISNPNANRKATAKENMLAGRYYHPYDKELVLERERCNGACWRFNASTNPNNGVSPEERSRLFRDILQPRDHVLSPTLASPVSPVGRVGENVTVEAPFNCDYGYNITIGQEVSIGKNCTILDTCEVKIGDRVVVGPNVNIYTAALPVDPKRRKGSQGPHLGRKVVIGDDCWIGGNVTILPGRTIGANSTVGAGSIVTRDVPPNVIACGNPARVLRGVGR